MSRDSGGYRSCIFGVHSKGLLHYARCVPTHSRADACNQRGLSSRTPHILQACHMTASASSASPILGVTPSSSTCNISTCACEMCPLRSTHSFWVAIRWRPRPSTDAHTVPHSTPLTFFWPLPCCPRSRALCPLKLLSAPPPLLIKALPSVIAHSAREEMATELALWIRHSVSHSVSHSRRPSVGVPSTLAIDVDTEALG